MSAGSNEGPHSHHREKELKLALESAEDHRRLSEALPGFLGEAVQENYYWDLPDGALGARGIMLRLRLEDDAATITVKRDATRRDDGLFEADEHEESIPLSTAREVIAGAASLASVESTVVSQLVDEFGDLETLRRWGFMTNCRRRYRLADDLVAELDHTVFLEDHEEWEVELECRDPERGREVLLQRLDAAGVRYRPQESSKAARLHALIAAKRSTP